MIQFLLIVREMFVQKQYKHVKLDFMGLKMLIVTFLYLLEGFQEAVSLSND
jgi:hypothetical protein